MLPFLIDMNRLFELFVAEWLVAHLPKTHFIRPQEHVEITSSGNLEFIVDLVLYDAIEDRPLCVLDTKYKRTETPAAGDIEQVVAYAVSKRCHDAALVYPVHLHKPLETCVGGHVNVRSLTFALNGDIVVAGEALIESLAALEE